MAVALILSIRNYIFGFLTLEEGNDSLSRNVGKELPLLVA